MCNNKDEKNCPKRKHRSQQTKGQHQSKNGDMSTLGNRLTKRKKCYPGDLSNPND